MRNDALTGGFADPSLDAQRAFRRLLTALAEPGTIHTLSGAAPPAPFPVAMGVIAACLCDATTPVFLDPAYAEVAAWLSFHSEAPLTDNRSAAQFAFLPMPDLADFPIGELAYPDRSATVVCASQLSGQCWSLTGPGIEDERTLEADLPNAFFDAWQRNRALFPRGVDVLLVDGADVVGLPRTTRLERR